MVVMYWVLALIFCQAAPSDWSFDTITVQSDGNHKRPANSHAVPIFQTSSFTFDTPDDGRKLFAGEKYGHVYSRIGNPTVEALETSLAALEVEPGSEGYGISFSSGMGAVTAVVLSLLEAGDHIIVGNVLYGPSLNLISQTFTKFGILCSAIDTSNVEIVKAAIRPNTKMILFESPANPTGQISDIAEIVKVVHKSSESKIITCVDSTFASSYNQQPLVLGADLVLHSLTKYLGGHGDVVGGVVVTRNKTLSSIIRTFRKNSGNVLGPFDAWLVLRGLKTLSVRMEKHNSNAIIVANYLKSHPLIENVQFAYFPDFPNHHIAARQMVRHVHKKILYNSSITPNSSSSAFQPLYKIVEATEGGYGGTFSFTMKGGFESAKWLLENLHLATLCVSLGSTDTLIEHPGSMTHAGFSEEQMKTAGLTKSLIRISVGLEDAVDIIEDLQQGLAAVARLEQSQAQEQHALEQQEQHAQEEIEV